MAMRGRPCGRRRLTRPAKLRKRIISPPRHGGKASVWRNRSAIPRARRALFRFGHVGSFCQTPPCRRVPNRSRVLGRTPHCYSLLFFIVIHCYLRGRGRRAERTTPRGAGEMRRWVLRPHCYFIVINNAAVRERRARHQAARHDVRPQSGRAVPLRAGCWPASSSSGSALSYSRCQTARSVRRRQCVFLARRADRRPSGSSPEDHFECESL
jgi:hypothetical protein